MIRAVSRAKIFTYKISAIAVCSGGGLGIVNIRINSEESLVSGKKVHCYL